MIFQGDTLNNGEYISPYLMIIYLTAKNIFNYVDLDAKRRSENIQ